MAASPEPFVHNPGGGPSPDTTAQGNPKNVKVIVVHAGFGDVTLLEVEHDNGEFYSHGRVSEASGANLTGDVDGSSRL